MAKNEAFKLVARRAGRLWSWWLAGPATVSYSPSRWTKPKGVAERGRGERLSVFKSFEAVTAFSVSGWMSGDEVWRCMYRGKPQTEKVNPRGTLRVTSVKLIEKVWPAPNVGSGRP